MNKLTFKQVLHAQKPRSLLVLLRHNVDSLIWLQVPFKY